MNRKIRSISALFFAFVSLTGCVPGEVKREAEKNKLDHENEFIQSVQSELGPDYVLLDVQGYINKRVSDYSLFAEYSASQQLVGTIDHNGQKYNAMYDYVNGILYSDVYTDEIIDSLAEVLGLDTSKIIGGCIIDHNGRDFYSLFPVKDQSFEDMLVSYQGGAVEFYIVTSEDVYDLDFEDYKDLCCHKRSEFNVIILSSDDFKNSEHFQTNYYSIRDTGESHPVVDYENRSQDVFEVYDLKGFVRIDKGADDVIGDIEVKRY